MAAEWRGMVLAAVCLITVFQTAGRSEENGAVRGDERRLEQTDDLEAALKIANWLNSLERQKDQRSTWPVDPKRQEIVHHLYSGTAGIVLFYFELSRATNGETAKAFRQRARRGAETLLAEVESIQPDSEPGLFTGYSGYGYVLSLLGRELKDERYLDAAQRCVDHLKRQARPVEESKPSSVQWSRGVTDIVSGSAGIGYFLLAMNDAEPNQETLKLAIACGDGLIQQAKPVSEGEAPQCRWMMSPTFPREMPNYSHGTAGNCDFLLALHESCLRSAKVDAEFSYDHRFLKSALAGARYLHAQAKKSDQNGLIPHHFPDGEKLFYLGWCHGPAGTARFLNRLGSVTGDSRWRQLGEQAAQALLDAKLASERTDGFWNNVGLCCGSAGVASFLMDASKEHADPEFAREAKEQIKALTQDILRRATKNKGSGGDERLSWIHAEHRARPELLQAQTGLMQGAAGMGLFFLKRHADSKNTTLAIDLPAFPVFDRR